MSSKAGLLCAGIGALVLCATNAAAQSAVAANAPAGDAATPAEIIVTATKRSENVQKVPISMSVLSSARLSEFQATNIASIMNAVPNLFVEQIAGQTDIYIRGFGSPPANYSFDQSVSTYMDGIYAGKPRQEEDPFFDVERVEVLRGPQGALFGKNTAAGAINVVSAAPTSQLSGAMTGLYNFNQQGYDANGYISGPISDTLSARLAVRSQDQDGYIRNLYNGNEEPKEKAFLIRGTLRWRPSADFDDTLKVEYENVQRLGGYNSSGSLTERQAPLLVRYGPPNPLGREGLTNQSILISNTANVYFGDYTLTSVTGYSQYHGNAVNTYDPLLPDGKTVVPNTVYNSYPEWFHQYSQEFRILSPKGRFLEYVAGVYADVSTFHLDQFQGFNLAAIDYLGLMETYFGQKSRSVSPFAQATFNLQSSLRVIASVRYTNTHRSGYFGGNLIYGPFALQPVDTSASGAFTEGHVDPSATVQYDVATGVMVYATFGQGSKSGGFVSNTFGTNDATFEYRPERSTNFEAGVKFSALNKLITGSLTVYDTRFKDLQVSTYDPSIAGYITGNAASATSKGFEGEITLRTSRHFDITANGAYMDIKYDNYPGAACLATQTVEQCDPTSASSIAANNLAGYRPAFTSKFNGSVTAHGQIDLGANLRLDAQGVAAGRSSYNASDTQDPIFGFQKGYVKIDARVQISPPDGRWHLAFVGKNLTNQLTISNAFDLPLPITTVARAIKYVEPPRSFAIEAGVKF